MEIIRNIEKSLFKNPFAEFLFGTYIVRKKNKMKCIFKTHMKDSIELILKIPSCFITTEKFVSNQFKYFYK